MRAKIAIVSCLAWVMMLCPARRCPAIVVCPSGDTQQGVDVSRWQGTVDWSQVAASGVTFAFARVADGLSVDPYFAANYAGIKAAGLVRGAYQSLRPGQDTLDQAALVLSNVGSLGPGDLPPALEVAVTDGRSAAEIGQAVEDWSVAIQEATGRRPLILTSAFFWDDTVLEGGAAENPLWVAHWDVACPNTPSLWQAWAFWQYSATGSVPGIGGLVDRDVFNGPLSELQILAGMPPVEVSDAILTPLRLLLNQPNPFNPRTTLRFDVPAGGEVRLEIYDVAGRLIRTLLAADLPAGSHQAAWDGTDSAGRGMPSGCYFARLTAGGKAETVRMGLVR